MVDWGPFATLPPPPFLPPPLFRVDGRPGTFPPFILAFLFFLVYFCTRQCTRAFPPRCCISILFQHTHTHTHSCAPVRTHGCPPFPRPPCACFFLSLVRALHAPQTIQHLSAIRASAQSGQKQRPRGGSDLDPCHAYTDLSLYLSSSSSATDAASDAHSGRSMSLSPYLLPIKRDHVWISRTLSLPHPLALSPSSYPLPPSLPPSRPRSTLLSPSPPRSLSLSVSPLALFSLARCLGVRGNTPLPVAPKAPDQSMAGSSLALALPSIDQWPPHSHAILSICPPLNAHQVAAMCQPLNLPFPVTSPPLFPRLHLLPKQAPAHFPHDLLLTAVH